MSIFTQVQMEKNKYSTFDLSHQKKLSLNMGELVPVMCMETVPGDKFTSQTAQLVRFAPMIAPMMHQVSVYTHFFFVPNRILWENWETFITGGDFGEDQPVFPTVAVNLTETAVGSLADYFGIPQNPNGLQGKPINALPFAAYQKIYNEYFRDQNLINEVQDEVVDGNNSSVELTTMRRRAWQHDYFTSALPWTQKGPQATIPLGTNAPIEYIEGLATPSTFRNIAFPNDPIFGGNGDIGMDTNRMVFDPGTQNLAGAVDNSAVLSVDLSQATAASIIDLRNAFRLQEWLEKNARGGTRYNESIMAHFGVDVGDARLNRPEFLGGGSQPLSVSEVLQTSSTDGITPQANMAGHAISSGQSSAWSYRCKEHGFIIGICSIMPKTAYQDGIHKQWLKFDKFDYYFPEFAHIGEQPIQNQEVYFDNTPDDEGTFGYTPRYAEYKYMNDQVAGEFRTTLDFWHMGRKFQNRPALNQTFIECDPTTRIFANELGEQCYMHMYHSIRARRGMPYFGNPKI